MQALAADPRQLDDLTDRVNQLGAVSKVALIVEGLAILNTPIAIGVRDVVLVIVDRHESARLGTQQLQKSFEVSLDDISSLEHDSYLLAQRHHSALINVGTPLVKPLSMDMRPCFRQVVKNRRVDGIKRLTISLASHILAAVLCKPTFPIGGYCCLGPLRDYGYGTTGKNGASATSSLGEPMETIEALTHRRSCRNYSDRPVEAEKLARIIEAGQYAPSGMGRQPVTFVAVTDPATVERLSQLNAQVMGSNGDPFYGAKTVVVVLVDRSVPTHLEDGSLAMGNLLNAAYALGVDSCWIHRAHEVFDSPEGLELLASWGLPADGNLRGVGNCILGYAEDTPPEAKPRRDNVVYVR